MALSDRSNVWNKDVLRLSRDFRRDDIISDHNHLIDLSKSYEEARRCGNYFHKLYYSLLEIPVAIRLEKMSRQYAFAAFESS